VTSRPLAQKPHNGRRRLIWPAAPVALVLLAISACGSNQPADPSAHSRVPREAVTGDRLAAHAVPRRVARPRWIRIPAIGVSAPVGPIGLNEDRTIQVPREFGKGGWYRLGPKPGERGPAVIVGHVDSKSGPAVFYRLRELKPGNRILVRRADGSTARFRVNGLERWPKSEFPTRRVYGRTRGPVLRLVTCSGNFDASAGHYVDNTIVFASRLP
jgi:hypothetical protein